MLQTLKALSPHDAESILLKVSSNFLPDPGIHAPFPTIEGKEELEEKVL